MYRIVDELSKDELKELRSRLYYKLLDDGSLDEVMGKEIDSEDDIPMHFVKEHYEGTFFVEEDFWCNLKN